MNNENIYEIRRKAILEIKEKIKKNPKYLHPCNKERQEDMKRLGFSNGNDFTHWMQQSGIMKNSTYIDRNIRNKTVENAECKTEKEYRDKLSQNAGFKDWAEQVRKCRHETGRHLPKESNIYCSLWFGDFICENYIIKTFEDPIRMPHGNPGFDWLCKNGEKIDSKGRCLMCTENRSPCWQFSIKYNKIADWFILSAWDNRDSLNPLHVWAFHKNYIVRGKKFCEFETFRITNTPEKLKELEKYEVTNRLDKLKELCNKKKRIKTFSDN